MSLEIKESKIEADINFLLPGRPEKQVGPYSALVHLFEHDYGGKYRFWFGVADVTCSIRKFHNDAVAAGLPANAETIHTMNEFGILLKFKDGRMGHARFWAGEFEQSTSDQHSQFAFACETALRRPT